MNFYSKKINIIAFVMVIIFIFFTGFVFAQESGASKEKSSDKKPVTENSTGVHSGQNFRYLISWQDQIVGYSKFFVAKKMALAGEGFFNIESVSKLKIGMGNIQQISIASEMTIREKDLKPTHFASTQKHGEIETGVDCIISDSLIYQGNLTPVGERNNIISLEPQLHPDIYMNNLWGRIDTMMEHYWLLVKTGENRKDFVYDPVLQYQGNMNLKKTGDEKIKFNGKQISTIRYLLKDFQEQPLFHIWADRNGKIYKMQEPGGGLTFILTNADVEEKLNQAEGVNIWKNRVGRSNMFFPNVEKINYMEILLKLEGRGFENLNIEQPGFKQEFLPITFVEEKEEDIIEEVTVKEEKIEDETVIEEDVKEVVIEKEVVEKEQVETRNLVEGKFVVQTTNLEIENPPAYPVKVDMPAEVLKYLEPEIGIEADNDFIHNKGLEAAHKSKHMWEAVKKINAWVSSNIPNGIALPSALMTLMNEQGNSESKAHLAIALCRTLDIPSRKVGGLIFSEGSFIPHYWYEVYIPETGWVPMDPTFNEAGKLNASHVRLFTGGEIWKLSVDVVDFKPRPKERVTYFNRELIWPVGEEKTFLLRSGPTVLGEEKAIVEQVGIFNDQEAYFMKLSSSLDIAGRTIDIDATYWMTPQGLPLRYEKILASGERFEKHSYEIKDGIIIQDVETNLESFRRKIPVSRGVYMVDTHILTLWPLIFGQFPDPAIGKLYEFSIFIPETLTMKTLEAQVKKFEAVEVGDRIVDAFRVETDNDIVFWLEKQTGKVVKVNFESQEVELELKESELKF
ncbi:MAG: transglutaminase-like domain-containing protein [Vulcanimicrobiota bacterium]